MIDCRTECTANIAFDLVPQFTSEAYCELELLYASLNAVNGFSIAVPASTAAFKPSHVDLLATVALCKKPREPGSSNACSL